MTTRFDRNRLAHIDTVLDRLDREIEFAKRRAVFELQQFGVQVRTVDDARHIRQQYRTAVRQQADAIARMNEISAEMSTR